MSVISICFIMLSVALVLAFTRLVRGPSLPDRVVALDLIGIISVGVIILHGLATETAVLFDAAIVLALVSFAGTIAFAKYFERSGGRK